MSSRDDAVRYNCLRAFEDQSACSCRSTFAEQHPRAPPSRGRMHGPSPAHVVRTNRSARRRAAHGDGVGYSGRGMARGLLATSANRDEDMKFGRTNASGRRHRRLLPPPRPPFLLLRSPKHYTAVLLDHYKQTQRQMTDCLLPMNTSLPSNDRLVNETADMSHSIRCSEAKQQQQICHHMIGSDSLLDDFKNNYS